MAATRVSPRPSANRITFIRHPTPSHRCALIALSIFVGLPPLVAMSSVASADDLPGSRAFCESGPAVYRTTNALNSGVSPRTFLNTNYVSAGVAGMRNWSSATITLAGVSGTIRSAYLYWHGPTNSTDPNFNATMYVNGLPVTGTNIGFSHDNCWGFVNSQAYRADVTARVRARGNGSYLLTGFNPSCTNGASLLVFFDDGSSANKRDIVLFEGNDSNFHNSYDFDGWTLTLLDINVPDPLPPASVSLEMHVSDGQYYLDPDIFVNGVTLVPSGHIFDGLSVPSTNSGPNGFGSLWDIRNFDLTPSLATSNDISLTSGVLDDCTSLIVAVINLPAGSAPCQLVCDAGGPYSAECQGATTAVHLDGTASSQFGGLRPAHYAWSTDCPGATFDDATSITPILTVPTPGPGDVNCTATLTISRDAPTCAGTTSTCSAPIHIGACNRPPDCSNAVAADPVLWPPDHTYHAVEILGVTDPDNDPVTITVTDVTQDEPANSRGDGSSCPDAQIVDGRAVVRAERAGTPGLPGNGRVYAIHFTASDGKGGTCTGTVGICVPHDIASPACVDDGQSYSSLGGCRGVQVQPEDFELTVSGMGAHEATVEFALPVDTRVRVGVYDVAGRQVALIENGWLASGVYQRMWDMGAVAKGVYFVRLTAGEKAITRTVIKTR